MTDDPYTTLVINKVIMKFKYYCEMYNIGHISMWHNITIGYTKNQLQSYTLFKASCESKQA